MLEPLCKQVVSHICPVNETDTANMQIRTLRQGLGIILWAFQIIC